MRALGRRQRKIHAAGWLLLIVLLPVMKWTESPSWSMFLWAEDATLFLRQGIDLGATALATPYAGYIHLVPRLAAWGATLLPASLYPAALVSGWWLAYLVTGFLLIRWAKEMNLPAGWGVVAVVAVVLQPHGGEVFFSATNAQWWLGLYLFVYFIWLDQRLVGSVWLRVLDCVSIVLVTLSGPFVFLVWPVIALRRWTEGRRYVWSWLHAWVLLAGLLQLALFLSGDRVHRHEGAVFHLDQWAIAFVRLLAFCADGPVQMSLAVAFLLVCTWVVWRDRRAVDRLETQDALIVVGCIGYLLLAGIWAHKFDPMQTVPLGTGSRYTWIPYALFLLLVCRSASRSTPLAQVASRCCCSGSATWGIGRSSAVTFSTKRPPISPGSNRSMFLFIPRLLPGLVGGWNWLSATSGCKLRLVSCTRQDGPRYQAPGMAASGRRRTAGASSLMEQTHKSCLQALYTASLAAVLAWRFACGAPRLAGFSSFGPRMSGSMAATP